MVCTDSRRYHFELRRSLGAMLLTAALVLVGCSQGPQPPALHPVKGKVVKGGKAITAGTVQFRATTDNGLTTLGDLDAEGNFVLGTNFNNKRLLGAPAGPHKATVILPAGGENRSITPVDVITVFTVEAGDNQITVDLDKAAK